MEHYRLEHAIDLICVRAEKFPEGILKAHQTLHALLPPAGKRKYFGISYPEKGGAIIYKASAEALHEKEAEELGCEKFRLKKGKYISILIRDYLKDIQSIKRAFDRLIVHPEIDPEGCCVEYFVNDTDVRCMIRLASSDNVNSK